MLQSCHALKTASRTEAARPSRTRGTERSVPGLLVAATAQLAAESGGRNSTPDSDPGRAGCQDPPLADLAHFTAALGWGMRARWPQVAAEQLLEGERSEARGRQPRPEVSAAEVCVGSSAAPPARVGGTYTPLLLRGKPAETSRGPLEPER